MKFPFPIGNILGGGAHAGPGTPDIQEILVAPTGAKTIHDAIDMNLQVHKELRNVIQKMIQLLQTDVVTKVVGLQNMIMKRH